MSSDISFIARCTGSARIFMNIVSPKSMPRRQTAIPPRRSVNPLTPRKETVLRSGRTMDASLPCAKDGRRNAAAVRTGALRSAHRRDMILENAGNSIVCID